MKPSPACPEFKAEQNDGLCRYLDWIIVKYSFPKQNATLTGNVTWFQTAWMVLADIGNGREALETNKHVYVKYEPHIRPQDPNTPQKHKFSQYNLSMGSAEVTDFGWPSKGQDAM